MQVNLHAQGMWQAVDHKDDEEVEYRNDRPTLVTNLHAVPPEMLGRLVRKRMT
jgi:hypothetical protein